MHSGARDAPKHGVRKREPPSSGADCWGNEGPDSQRAAPNAGPTVADACVGQNARGPAYTVNEDAVRHAKRLIDGASTCSARVGRTCSRAQRGRAGREVFDLEISVRQERFELVTREVLLPDAVDSRGAPLVDHGVLPCRHRLLRVVQPAFEDVMGPRPPEACADARGPARRLRALRGSAEDACSRTRGGHPARVAPARQLSSSEPQGAFEITTSSARTANPGRSSEHAFVG
jgi:hypothetical protein